MEKTYPASEHLRINALAAAYLAGLIDLTTVTTISCQIAEYFIKSAPGRIQFYPYCCFRHFVLTHRCATFRLIVAFALIASASATIIKCSGEGCFERFFYVPLIHRQNIGLGLGEIC